MRRTAILLAMLVAAAPVGAQSGTASGSPTTIDNSRHDFSRAARAADVADYDGQICVYCHTPHNATTSNTALWNRTLTTFQTTNYFTMYFPQGTGTTWSNARDQQPGQQSLVCLSCHEGTVAIDNITNNPLNTAVTSLSGKVSTINTGANLGTSLANDHPIAVELPASGTEWKNPPTSPVKLFGTSRVECSSCHNPHLPGTSDKFLRVENTNSNLCKACHTK